MHFRNLLWSLIFLVPPVHADELSPQYSKCVGKTSTNTEWGDCGRVEIGRQEAALNIAWKKALACFSTPQLNGPKATFLESQRLWVKWKDLACDFYREVTGPDGGPAFGREGEVLEYPVCKATIVAQRKQFLVEFAKNCS